MSTTESLHLNDYVWSIHNFITRNNSFQHFQNLYSNVIKFSENKYIANVINNTLSTCFEINKQFKPIVINLSNYAQYAFHSKDLEYWSIRYLNSSHEKKNKKVDLFLQKLIKQHIIDLRCLLDIIDDENPLTFDNMTIKNFIDFIGFDDYYYSQLGSTIKNIANNEISLGTFIDLFHSIFGLSNDLLNSKASKKVKFFLDAVTDVLVGKQSDNKELNIIKDVFSVMLENYTFMDEKQVMVVGNDVVSARANLRALSAAKSRNHTIKSRPTIQIIEPSKRVRVTRAPLDLKNLKIPNMIPGEDKKEERDIAETPKSRHKHKEKEHKHTKQKIRSYKDKIFDTLFSVADSKIKEYADQLEREDEEEDQKSIPSLSLKLLPSIFEFDVYNLEPKKNGKELLFEEEFVFEKGKLAFASIDTSNETTQIIRHTPAPTPKKLSVEETANEKIINIKEHLQSTLDIWRREKEAVLMSIFANNLTSVENNYPFEEFMYNFTLMDYKKDVKKFAESVRNGEHLIFLLKHLTQNYAPSISRIMDRLEIIMRESPKAPKDNVMYLWRGMERKGNFTNHMNLIFENSSNDFVFSRIIEPEKLQKSPLLKISKMPINEISLNTSMISTLKKNIKSDKITVNGLLKLIGVNYTLGDYTKALGEVIKILERNFPEDSYGSAELIGELKAQYKWLLVNHERASINQFTQYGFNNTKLINNIIIAILKNGCLDDVLSAIDPNLAIKSIVESYQDFRMPSIANLFDRFIHRKHNRRGFLNSLLVYIMHYSLIRSSDAASFRDIALSELAVLLERAICRSSRWSLGKIIEYYFGKEKAAISIHMLDTLAEELLII